MHASFSKLNTKYRRSQSVTTAINFATLLVAALGDPHTWLVEANLEVTMPVSLYRERKRVKNGWNSRIPLLHLAAFGTTPEEADEQLKVVMRAFLAPFQRAGTLEQEMRALGLGPIDGELKFTLH